MDDTRRQLACLQEATDQMMWHVADAAQRRRFQLKHLARQQGRAAEGVKLEGVMPLSEQSGGVMSETHV